MKSFLSIALFLFTTALYGQTTSWEAFYNVPQGKKGIKGFTILGFHSSPEDAGKVFEQINPKLAVYSHIVLLTADSTISPPTINDLIIRTQKIYKGHLQVGEDFLSIEIGDTVKVSKFIATESKPTEVIK